MLEISLLIAIVSISSILLGLIGLHFYNKNSVTIINEHIIVLCFFIGLAVNSLLSAWLTLFFPLLFSTILPLLLICFGALLIKRRFFKWESVISYKKNKIEVLFFFIACLLFIKLGSLEPYMADTKTYHLQVVRWCQQYKAVPGLVNLGPRFCFPSNWFHLISLFSLSPNQGNLQFLNTALSLWVTYFILIKIIEHKEKLNQPNNKFFLFVYAFLIVFMASGWNLLRGNCRSLGNDFIVTSLSLYVLLNLIEELVLPKAGQGHKNILFFLAISIPFFKLSGAFVLIPLFIYFIHTKQPFKTYCRSVLLLISFVIPFFAKNYIQTGYPVFPYTFLDVFSPDWKLPPILMERFTSFNYLSNKFIYQGVPAYAWQEHTFNWLTSWFFRLAFYDQLLLLLYISSLLLLFMRKNYKSPLFRKVYLYVLSTIPIITAWFLLSPDPRFVYAYLLFTTFILLAYIIHSSHFLYISWGYNLILQTVLCFFFYKTLQFDSPYINAYSAPKPAHNIITIEKLIFHIPARKSGSTYCSDLPLPCIYQYNPYLQPRGNGIKDGFNMKQPIDTAFVAKYFF